VSFVAGRVSVIIPTRNRPETLLEAVQSALAQSYPHIELLVVNDGGVDPELVLAPLQSQHPEKLLVIHRKERGGLPAARNLGLSHATGEFIAYLDDDDLFEREHLSTLVPYLLRREADVVYGDCERVELDQEGGLVSKSVAVSPEFDAERILFENFIPVLAIVHRRDCLERCGNFDEWLTGLEDWELWFRFSREFRFLHVPHVGGKVFSRAAQSSIGSVHRFGYSWPALNALYKCKEAMKARPDVVALYEERVKGAVEHLQQTIFMLWQERSPDLRAVFGFHTPAQAYARLISLQEKYPSCEAGILQLRGMLKAQSAEYAAACQELRASLEKDPTQKDTASLLEILEKAESQNQR